MRKFFTLFLTAVLIFSLSARSSAEKVKFDKKLLKATVLEESPARDTPLTVLREKPEDVTIFGLPEATADQMVKFINSRNQNPKLNCTVREIVQIYYEEAGLEKIRADVALCQAIKETGTWNYGGDVLPEQNNYCGLGATGNKEKGAYFESPRIGVRAHIQHLLAYASKQKPKTEIVDPRYELIEKFRPQIFGKIKNWTGLNGVWAVPGNRYGQEILQLRQQAKIPDESSESMDAAEFKILTDDDKAAAYNERGLVYFARKDFRSAQSDFQKALEIEPTLKEAIFNSAVTFEKMNKPDDAIKIYDKYLQLDPQFDYALYNRGRLKLEKKLYKDAIADFRAALAIEDRFVDAQNEIAIALFRQKTYIDNFYPARGNLV